MNTLLNDLFDKGGAGGAAIVVKDGKTIYRKAFGMANLELAPDFIFRVAKYRDQKACLAYNKYRCVLSKRPNYVITSFRGILYKMPQT